MNEVVDVIVTGHLCVDLVPRTEHIPLERLVVPGRVIEIGMLDISTGGAVSNTGLALHHLGVNVRLMATIGDDLLGRVVLAFLEGHDSRLTQYISIRPGQRGSYTVVLSPQNADRVLMHYPGPNTQFGVGNVDFSLLAGAKIFHLGYPPILLRLMANDGEELEEIYRRAKATGIVTSMDTSLPDPQGPAGQVDWHKILSRSLPYVDIFVPSIEEIIFMLRRKDYEAWYGEVLSHLTADYLAALARELLDMGSAVVGFKLGEMGFYLESGDASQLARLSCLPLDATAWTKAKVWSPAYQADVVGAAGAGDSAYAGLLAALLRGMNPSEAVQWACAVGACNVEAADTTSGVRSWQETEARLKAGWPTRAERLPGMA
jgi:sugar/nucleoside kinase (ribokinase family)